MLKVEVSENAKIELSKISLPGKQYFGKHFRIPVNCAWGWMNMKQELLCHYVIIAGIDTKAHMKVC